MGDKKDLWKMEVSYSHKYFNCFTHSLVEGDFQDFSHVLLLKLYFYNKVPKIVKFILASEGKGGKDLRQGRYNF